MQTFFDAFVCIKAQCKTFHNNQNITAMKKSLSILSVLAVLALCLSVGLTSCSQMGLKNELAKYYQSDWSRLSDNFSVVHFKALTLEQMNTMENCPYTVATERDAIAEKLALEYCEQQLFNNLADIALPYMEKHLTVVEMKKVNSAVKDETQLASVVKIANIMRNDFAAIVNDCTGSAIADIVNGEEPPVPSLHDEMSSDYLPVVETFYEVSGRKVIVENSYGAMNEMLRSGAPESQTLAETFFAYLSRVTPRLMCMVMYDKVSKEELEQLIEVYERPEFVKLKQANIDFSQEIANANAGVNELFLQWLDKQI